MLPTATITAGYSCTTGTLTSLSGLYGETLTFGYDGGLLSDVSYSGAVLGSLHWQRDANLRVVNETLQVCK